MKLLTAFLNLLSIAATTTASTIERDLAVFTRTEEQYVYALMNDFRNFCGYDNHAARRCNGKLASIGNADELALMKMLLGRNSGVVSVSGGFSQSAWIGGEYNSTSSTWGWSDGSPWFDDQEALWQDGAVSPGPNILFRTDGTEYWYQPITSDACGSAKGEGILILPADYDDPNAPFYETNDFALCQDQVINKIIDSVSTTGNGWQIVFNGLDADFASSSDTEVTLKYDIGKNGPFGNSDSGIYKTILYEKDCATEIDTTGEGLFTLADSGRIPKNPEDPLFSSVELWYDVDKSLIGSSSVWNSTTNQIEICQVVQLVEESDVLGEMIITEDTRVVTIDFDLSASFNVTAGLEEAALTSATGNTTLDDYLLAYKCDEAFVEDNSPLVENDELYICFESISSDVEIDEVEAMAVTQGETYIPVIVGSVVEFPVITEETVVSPTSQVVMTRVPSNLIDFASGNTIDVVGTVIMQFIGEGSGRRKLRADAKTDRTGFDVKVDLESKAIDGDVHASESSASFGTKSEAITSLVFASAYIIMLWM